MNLIFWDLAKIILDFGKISSSKCRFERWQQSLDWQQLRLQTPGSTSNLTRFPPTNSDNLIKRSWSIFIEPMSRERFRAPFGYVLKIQKYLFWFDLRCYLDGVSTTVHCSTAVLIKYKTLKKLAFFLSFATFHKISLLHFEPTNHFVKYIAGNRKYNCSGYVVH